MYIYAAPYSSMKCMQISTTMIPFPKKLNLISLTVESRTAAAEEAGQMDRARRKLAVIHFPPLVVVTTMELALQGCPACWEREVAVVVERRLAADHLLALREGREVKPALRALVAARKMVLVVVREGKPAAPGKGREVGVIKG